MNKTNHIGEVVRFHRKAAELTRKNLSELAGVGETTIYDVEHGKETVRLSTLLNLLDALNITLRLESLLMSRFDKEHNAGETSDANR